MTPCLSVVWVYAFYWLQFHSVVVLDFSENEPGCQLLMLKYFPLPLLPFPRLVCLIPKKWKWRLIYSACKFATLADVCRTQYCSLFDWPYWVVITVANRLYFLLLQQHHHSAPIKPLSDWVSLCAVDIGNEIFFHSFIQFTFLKFNNNVYPQPRATTTPVTQCVGHERQVTWVGRTHTRLISLASHLSTRSKL